MKRFQLISVATAALFACIAIPETESLLVGAGGNGGNSGGGSGATNQNGGSISGATGDGGTADTAGMGAMGPQPAEGGGAGATGGDGAGATGGTGATGSGGDNGSGGDGGSGGTIAGHPDPDFDYPTYTGYTLNMVEEFEDPLDLVADPIWTYGDGGPPEGQARYVKSAVTFASGYLKLTVSNTPVASSQSYSLNGNLTARNLSSGELRTKFNNYRYGRYEARIRAPYPNPPTGNGNFLNDFQIHRQPQTQDWREIFSTRLGESSTALVTNVLYGDNQANWSADIQEFIDTYPSGTGTVPLPGAFDSRDAFHVYAFEWTPSQIRWYVDGALIRVKDDGLGANGLSVPEKSAKILLNIWVFANNAYGGDPATNVYPFTVDVDWFRFYKLDTEATYPCSPTPNCLPADDLDLAKNNGEDGL